MELFSRLAAVLACAETVTFKVTAQDNGRLSVAVIPTLKEAKDGLSDADAQLRAALSVPLCVRGTAEELDNSFLAQLDEYNLIRADVGAEVAGLDALRDQAKRGRNAAAKARQEAEKRGADGKGASTSTNVDSQDEKTPETGGSGNHVQGTAPAPGAGAETHNPDSVF